MVGLAVQAVGVVIAVLGLQQTTTEAVGGPEGGGIDKQFWGLTLVLAGSALAVLGGLL